LETQKIASAVWVRYRQLSIAKKGVGWGCLGNNLPRTHLTDDQFQRMVGHAFQSFNSEEHYRHTASEDAWEKVLNFFAEKLKLK